MHTNPRVPALPRTISLRSLGWLAVALMLAVAIVPWAGARTALSANPDGISVAAPTDVTVVVGATASFGLLTVTSSGNSLPCNTTLSAVDCPPAPRQSWYQSCRNHGRPGDELAQIATGAAAVGVYTFAILDWTPHRQGERARG